MVVVDTSAWIERLAGSPIAEQLQPLRPSREDTIVPTPVQLELAKWLTREVDEEAADRAVDYTERCSATRHPDRVRAAKLCRVHKSATADAVIYATALEAGAKYLTCDAHLTAFRR